MHVKSFSTCIQVLILGGFWFIVSALAFHRFIINWHFFQLFGLLMNIHEYVIKSYHLVYRVPTVDSNNNGRLLHQRSGLSENGLLSCRSSSGTLNCMTENGNAVDELQNGIEETRLYGHQMPLGTKGFVNRSDSPNTNTQLEIVNNSENSRMEAQLKFVNNNSEDLKMGNLFGDEGDEYD